MHFFSECDLTIKLIFIKIINIIFFKHKIFKIPLLSVRYHLVSIKTNMLTHSGYYEPKHVVPLCMALNCV